MTFYAGLDIGGTKTAGAIYDSDDRELAQVSLPTPGEYDAFLETCRVILEQLWQVGKADTLGACAPYADNFVCSNVPYLAGKDLKGDLAKLFGRPVPLGNDANCAALAEAMAGPGKGYRSVFGLIMGTGVGGGLVLDGQIFVGANGLCGEVGHLPLPCREESDGPSCIACGCGQKDCIECFISGSGLSRLYYLMTKHEAEAKDIGAFAAQGDKDALGVLDRFYTTVAKAMVVVLHTFDPDIIIVSGGLNSLPGLYDAVPKRWGRYGVSRNPKTKFVPASFGAMAGLRGAAVLGRKEALV